MSKASTRQLVSVLKEQDQDFEWYPTTPEIIDCVKADYAEVFVHESPSILDCGAGDGRVLKALTDGRKYAIEKARPLLDALDKEIFVVGTEFYQQTLIDKKVDLVFSNPPYSDYDYWAAKILREANAGYVYLILPARWEASEEIQAAIKLREIDYEVIGETDFFDAERQARAVVHIIRLRLTFRGRYSTTRPKVDPFYLWFNDNFHIDIANEEPSKFDLERFHKSSLNERVQQALVKGDGIVSVLENLYQADLEKLITTYQSFCDIDPTLLRELDVNLEGVRGALASKIDNLKDRYWHELFNNLCTITDKLTAASRKAMLATLTAHTHVDFSSSNAHAIICWVVKNANEYFDSQLVSMVESMTEQANVITYQSNQRTFGKEEWRYCRRPEGLDCYQLDYRIVLERTGGISSSSYSSDQINGLCNSAAELVHDLCTIAGNLLFDIRDTERVSDFQWESNKKNVFHYMNHSTGELEILFDIRAFKNGNLHIRFNPRFICRLNVEFGRLKGWLKTPKEAMDELGVSAEDAVSSFGNNLKITVNNVLALDFKCAS